MENLIALVVGVALFAALGAFSYFIPYADFILMVFSFLALSFAFGTLVMTAWKFRKSS